MNNFASGAIPNTRVTMRPNLTAGLFLNGRSSTYGRGAGIILNDITFIETCGEKGKADEIPQHRLDSAVFPTVHSEIYSDHQDIQHDKRQITQPNYCEDSETFQEFIQRIEGEVNMKWDNSQQSAGVGCVSDIEECAKSESFEMDNSEDLSQCSDIEYDEPIRQSLHGIVSSFDEESISANQVMAEDWEQTGYERSLYWGGNYHDEHGVSDARMVGFWRPNHF
ncbi:hypothetical protein FVER53590_00901 [Fusarium verticillioides]|nr:hypothetical protein FVER53590_00901 [Fusarium verticillioides]